MKKILAEDIAELKFLSGAALNATGELLAYTVTESDRKANCYKANVNVYNTKTGASAALDDAGKHHGFIWDDAETLLINAALSPEDEFKPYDKHASYYRVNALSGEKTKAFNIKGEVDSIKKLSDGVYAVTIVIDKNAPDPELVSAEECEEALDYHVIEEAPLWENGRGYISGKRTRLFIYKECDNSLTAVTNETTEVRSFQISGSYIAIVGRDWQDTLQDTLTGLYLYDLESGVLETIIPKDTAKVGKVEFIGDKLLYTMTDCKTFGNGQLGDFYLYDIEEKKSSFLCANDGLAVCGGVLTDVCYGSGTNWKRDGGKVYFIGLRGYERAVYSIGTEGLIEKITGIEGGSVEQFEIKDGEIYFLGLAMNEAPKLYKYTEDTEAEMIIDLNKEYFEDRFVSPAEHLVFTNSAGIELDGWVIKPIDYDSSKSYPALFEIHGGPRCAYGNVFMHEMQMFASKGYFVFFCNPRGSEGKGEEFADIRGKHGTIDYDDLMEFTDFILSEYPQIDPKRVAAAGGSYAGFMCNWIEGHTDRYAAIASQRSVSEFVEDFCVSDIGFTYDKEAAGGNPWDNTEKLWFHSPYKYAPFAKTPILFIHSLCDYDCTIDQGVSMFQAMKYFGVPTRMCLFEGENHELSRSGKPKHRIRRLNEIAAWIDKYLN